MPVLIFFDSRKVYYSVSPEFARWFYQTCEAADVRTERFGIIDDGNPNAFTCGRARGDACILLTSGLIDILTPEELLAVVAHEIIKPGRLRLRSGS